MSAYVAPCRQHPPVCPSGEPAADDVYRTALALALTFQTHDDEADATTLIPAPREGS